MNMVEATVPITKNEDIQHILTLMQGNGMQRDKQEIESLASQISFMETQFEKVFSELQDVKSQLQAIQDKGIRAAAMRIVDTAEVKISEVKNQFIAVKDNVIKSFTDAKEAVKEKGVSALNKALNYFGVRSALSRLQGKLRDSASAVQQGVSRIEDMKGQIHEAGVHAQNAGRVMIGKDAKEITAHNSDHGILSGVQKLLNKTGGMLSGMGKITASAIGKIDKLERNGEKSSVRQSLKSIRQSQTSGQAATEKVPQDKAR